MLPAHPTADGTSAPTTAAFFDVDNTFIDGSSLYYLAKGLRKRHFFTFKDIAEFSWKQIRFQLTGENMGHLHSVRETALQFVAGHRSEELAELSEDIFDEIIHSRLWSGTRALAQEHLDAGHSVWLVTGTPIEVARVLAQRLGLTGALGTVGEIVDGVYTGKLVGEVLHGPAKAIAIKDLAASQNIDLNNSWAYSDSINDLPMLDSVGHPVAVNPDKKLTKHAKEHGWKIYDFRSGRRAASLGLRIATVTGAVFGAWRAYRRMKRNS